jgi:hypothetical protein
MPLFPEPSYFGKRRHWRLSELLAYEAAAAGKPPPEPGDPAEERYLTATQVKTRYQVSDMWLHRRSAERPAERGAPEAA